MTERSSRHVHRERSQFVVGPSRLAWMHDHLRIEFDEVGAPLPLRVRGVVRLYPKGLSTFVTALDQAGAHRWGPIAPCARVEVELDRPAAAWRGHGYFDSNEGTEPVDRPFLGWNWSRAELRDGSTAVIYDVRHKSGGGRVIAERFAPDGSATAFEAPPRQALPRTLWRLDRAVHAEPPVRVTQVLEDTPFYARCLLDAGLLGERVTAVHETLLPSRLTALPVRLMLPWRMPRRA